MQGRRDQENDPGNRQTGKHLSSLNGTGQHRTVPGRTGQYRAISGDTGQYRPIPQRPPGMPRVDTPPPTPKIERPKREAVSPHTLRRRLLMLSAAIVICAIVAAIIGVSTFNYFNALNANSGAAGVAVDFLKSLNSQSYDQAYKDLGPTVTLRLGPDAFKQQAQSYDHCFGTIQNYSEVSGSATKAQNNSQSYTYSVTRSKSTKPFQLRLTLQQDQDGNWRISDYGNTLGASQPTCR